MTFLKLLLNSSIIYITIIAIATPIANEESKIKGIETDEESKIAMPSVLNNKSSNISDYMFPIHYNIKIMLGTDYLHSVCIITLNISYAKRYIRFYVPDATFIVFSNLTLNQNNDTVYEANHTNIIKNNIVVLDFGDVSFHGIYDLYIEYIISINIVRESFGTPYINENEEIEWLIATGVQRRNKYQTKKQQMFPYWDKPKLRITFIISIIHYPKYEVWSNMPIRDIKLTDDNLIWTFFNATPLISIDRVAFLVSRFHHIILSDNETIRSSISYRPQSEPHLEFAKTVISSTNVYMHRWNIWRRELASLTSVSFENKIDHVVIPDLQNEIEQSFGFIFYREADITYNEELDPVAYKTRIARLIARGIRRKYIRNLFRPTNLWPHTWLNKGFNMFYSEYIIDKALPNSRMMDLFVVQIQHELFYLNTYVIINSTIKYNSYPENYLQSSLSQIKGSIIWRMLKRILPLCIFSKGLAKYFNNQLSKPEAKTADHLWNAMRSEMFELNYMYDFKIKDAINSWIMQKYPSVLKVTRNYSTNVVSVSVEFRNKLDEEEYYIPVSYTTESNPNFTITWTDISVTPWISETDSNKNTNNSHNNFIWLHYFTKTEFSLEKNQWIIFNLQQAGYYRVNYDIMNWEKIAQYLNSEKYSNIHVLNRAQIINDAFHFAIEKKLEFSIFWELVSYLAQETDYIAWYPMLKAFEIMSNIFPFLDFYPEFKGVLKFDFMQNITSKYENLDDENNVNDYTKCLKQELAKWECIINEKPCEEKSKSHLKWHLANPEENKLLPGWKRWTYCNGLKTADHYTWNKVFTNCMEANDTMLECLAYSKNFEIIINYLEIKISEILFKPSYNVSYLPFESIERTYALTANIFLSVLERNTKYMLTSLLSNYETIRHRRVSDIVTLIVIINNVYAKGQLGEIRKFVKRKLENSIIPNAEYKLETRLSEIEKQIKYFRSLFT
ncbi:aminopeptidase N-like [Camponotus floridanus]|uniref:aminopeptidase N-like n=2 Tax=Camponotus floridanus TaxID=104421 RepID=UPI000DC69A9F|nr:aminopeptidase N-like [Camponotus floridanus]